MGVVQGWGFWPGTSQVWVNAGGGGLGGLNSSLPIPLVIHLELKQKALRAPTKFPIFQLLKVLSWPGQWLSLCLRSVEIFFWVSTGRVLHEWLLYACHIVHCKTIPFICLLMLLLKLYCQLIFNSYKGWGRVNWNLWSPLLYFLCPCIVFRAVFSWLQKKVSMKVRGKEEKTQNLFWWWWRDCASQQQEQPWTLSVDQKCSQMHEEGGLCSQEGS